MMGTVVKCPTCGAQDFDLARYESMMVLSAKYALFTLGCPHCATKVSSVCTIPSCLRTDIEEAAMQLGCGMGRETPSL